MTSPGDLVMGVTGEDLSLLDSETFDLVWSALGLIVRNRYPSRDSIVATYLDPAGTLIVEAADGRTLDIPLNIEAGEAGAPTIDARSVEKPCPDCGKPYKPAGMAGHRRFAHAGSPEPSPIQMESARRDFYATAKAAANRTWAERVEQTA